MNNTEHATTKNFFKFLGVLISLIFSVFFILYRLWAKTDDSALTNAENDSQHEILQIGYSHPEHPQHNQYLIDMDIL